jgi:hypothetical protein
MPVRQSNGDAPTFPPFREKQPGIIFSGNFERGGNMSAFRINDRIRFRTLTPDGPYISTGQVIKILPGGESHWLHVRQDDGSVRMLFEATTQIDVVELEAA